jgi:hypothetical protein
MLFLPPGFTRRRLRRIKLSASGAASTARPPRRRYIGDPRASPELRSGHKYRRANVIAKSKARPSAIPTRITVCAFGRFEGGFCGGVTSHPTQSTLPFLSRTPGPSAFSAMNSTPSFALACVPRVRGRTWFPYALVGKVPHSLKRKG